MFFRNKKRTLELFFNLDFAQSISPENSVNLGISYADLSFYSNNALIASYVYPQDSERFIIQYSQGWVLKFTSESSELFSKDDVSYSFVALDYEGNPIMTQEGVVNV